MASRVLFAASVPMPPGPPRLDTVDLDQRPPEDERRLAAVGLALWQRGQ
jgi:hypothetical protein